MKYFIYPFLISCSFFTGCEKKTNEPASQNNKAISTTAQNGPYGSFSKWKSVGGDTLFSETLTLTYFYTEKDSPCNICYYQQNFPLWNDYDYTLSVRECAAVNDTLIMIDIDTNRKAVFKREK